MTDITPNGLWIIGLWGKWFLLSRAAKNASTVLGPGGMRLGCDPVAGGDGLSWRLMHFRWVLDNGNVSGDKASDVGELDEMGWQEW